jgi:hypothetical protein
MRIKKSELEKLIESFLLEDDNNNSSKKGKYKLYFCARRFIPPTQSSIVKTFLSTLLKDPIVSYDQRKSLDKLKSYADSGHAWIIIKKPGEELKSLSGKSGAAFSMMALRLPAGRYSGLTGVDDLTDKLQNMTAVVKDDKEKLDKVTDELVNIIKDSDWGALLKRVNYEPDTFQSANNGENFIVDMFRGESEEEKKKIIEKIEKAFSNYKEDVPYDPMPGTKEAPSSARNSNSFAYTLLRTSYSDQDVEARTGNKNNITLPGWGKIVKGLASK